MNASECIARIRPALLEKKATIYFRGEMMGNIHRLEVRAFVVQLVKWAQYSSAVEARFVKKGGRSAIGFVQSYQPSLVILEGWGHPEPAGIWNEPVKSGDVTTTTGRHSACSPEWATEFDALLREHVEKTGAKVLHDFRGHDSYAPLPAAEEAAA